MIQLLLLLIFKDNNEINIKENKNPPRIKNSFNKGDKLESNKIIFFSRESVITRGLYTAIFFKDVEIASTGNIVLEKNIKRDATPMAAKIEVSSDLNEYPMNMPKKIKTLEDKKRTSRTFDKESTKLISVNQVLPTKRTVS